MSEQLRRLLFLSFFVAVLAFALPWLTHFADRGISIAIVLLWIGLLIPRWSNTAGEDFGYCLVRRWRSSGRPH